jgi:hypothetical protein
MQLTFAWAGFESTTHFSLSGAECGSGHRLNLKTRLAVMRCPIACSFTFRRPAWFVKAVGGSVRRFQREIVGENVTTPNADLDELLAEPREALDVEVKEWLDLTNNDQRATVAKEIIALANHGGGYFVVGFLERSDGSDVNDWAQDAVQSIVAKYAIPPCSAGSCIASSRERRIAIP